MRRAASRGDPWRRARRCRGRRSACRVPAGGRAAPQSRVRSQAALPQPGAIALGRLERAIEGLAGGEDAILLDHDPVVVADREQVLQALVDLRAAGAELAEHAGGPGLLEALALCMEACKQIEVDVLEMHVVDQLARLAQERQRVAATEGGVAGVEAEAEQARVHLRQ